MDAWISNLLLKEFSGVTRGVAKAAGVAMVCDTQLKTSLASLEACNSQYHIIYYI